MDHFNVDNGLISNGKRTHRPLIGGDQYSCLAQGSIFVKHFVNLFFVKCYIYQVSRCCVILHYVILYDSFISVASTSLFFSLSFTGSSRVEVSVHPVPVRHPSLTLSDSHLIKSCACSALKYHTWIIKS